MKNRLLRGCILYWIMISVFWSAETGYAQEEKEPELFAKAAVLMDGYTGQILYGKNTDEILAMASTTKIMTCILALEFGKPQDILEVSAYAASMPDVQLHIQKGERYYLKDILMSLMLESHNDSAAAAAEWIGELIERKKGNPVNEISERTQEESRHMISVFADAMNQKAEEIGCESTYFITPNGLDASETVETEEGTLQERHHQTTAKELALIMRYCVSESPCAEIFLKVTQTRSYSFSDLDGKRTYSITNHNRYLDMKSSAISGKTGFTNKAGYCYVGAVKEGEHFLIVSLLACGWPPSKNRKWSDMNQLISYGVEQYKCQTVSKRIISGNCAIARIGEREYTVSKEEEPFQPFSVLIGKNGIMQENYYLILGINGWERGRQWWIGNQLIHEEIVRKP